MSQTRHIYIIQLLKLKNKQHPTIMLWLLTSSSFQILTFYIWWYCMMKRRIGFVVETDHIQVIVWREKSEMYTSISHIDKNRMKILIHINLLAFEICLDSSHLTESKMSPRFTKHLDLLTYNSSYFQCSIKNTQQGKKRESK